MSLSLCAAGLRPEGLPLEWRLLAGAPYAAVRGRVGVTL